MNNVHLHVSFYSSHTSPCDKCIEKSGYEFSFFRSRPVSTENWQRGICRVICIKGYSFRYLTYFLSLKNRANFLTNFMCVCIFGCMCFQLQRLKNLTGFYELLVCLSWYVLLKYKLGNIHTSFEILL